MVRQAILCTAQFVPAGSTAFESPTSCVVRSDARTDGCVWGSARLKFDFGGMTELSRNDCVLLFSSKCFGHSLGPAKCRVAVVGQRLFAGEVEQ
jgi:hypothetical protein